MTFTWQSGKDAQGRTMWRLVSENGAPIALVTAIEKQESAWKQAGYRAFMRCGGRDNWALLHSTTQAKNYVGKWLYRNVGAFADRLNKIAA